MASACLAPGPVRRSARERDPLRLRRAARCGQARARHRRGRSHPTSAAPAGGEPAPGAERRLWTFAARRIEPDALVFTDSFAFRYETRRPITGSFKDGGIVIAGTGPFYRWYVYMREVEDCRRRRGEACWFALAEKYQGRYAVVDPELDRAAPVDAGWTRIWSEPGWSLWQRSPSG